MDRLKKQIVLFSLCLLYILSFHACYVNLISPAHSYYGFTYYEGSNIHLWSIFIFALLPSIWLPLKIKRPSQVLYYIIYILIYVPSCLVPYYIGISYYESIKISFFLFVGFALIFLIYKVPLIKTPSLQLYNIKYIYIILTITIVSYLLIQYYLGFNIKIISLLEVYELRDDFKVSRNRVVMLAVIWQANIVNPLLMAYGLTKKKYLYFGLGLIGQLLIFLVTGFKSVFFSFVLVGAIYFCLTWKPKRFGYVVITGIISVILFASITDYLTNTNLATTFLVRRVIAMPGLMMGYYYEFFSNSEYALLGHSIFSSFIEYPYDLSPPLLMGSQYWNDPTTSANGNFLADGYANFGFLGILIFSVLLAIILWLYDSVSSGKNIKIAAIALGIPAFTLSNSALLITLNTHGMGLLIILIYLYPKIKLSHEKYLSKIKFSFI